MYSLRIMRLISQQEERYFEEKTDVTHSSLNRTERHVIAQAGFLTTVVGRLRPNRPTQTADVRT